MKTKILITFLVFIGIVLFAGISNASTAETIQPASIIYNENMQVNGSLQVNSLKVGYEGVGGVTYFNGSILNIGANVPLTIADDLRIDGMIWRGPSKGQADNMPLKFADSLAPVDTNAFNLGFSDKRWKDLYLAGLLYGEDIIVGRELWGGTKKGIVDGDDPLFVSDSMYPTKDDINNLGSSDNRWQDLYLSGMLQGNDAIFTGNVDFSGATVTGLPIGDYYTKAQSDGRYLQLTGGILTGNISVSGVSGLTDADVPDTITASNYLPLAGGSLSGNLNLPGITTNVIVGGDILMPNNSSELLNEGDIILNGSDNYIGDEFGDQIYITGRMVFHPFPVEPQMCTSSYEGSVYYSAIIHEMCFCNGTDARYQQFDGGGDCPEN